MMDKNEMAKQMAEGMMQEDNMAMKSKWEELRGQLKTAGEAPGPIMELLQASFEAGWASGSLNFAERVSQRLEKLLEKFDPMHEKK